MPPQAVAVITGIIPLQMMIAAVMAAVIAAVMTAVNVLVFNWFPTVPLGCMG